MFLRAVFCKWGYPHGWRQLNAKLLTFASKQYNFVSTAPSLSCVQAFLAPSLPGEQAERACTWLQKIVLMDI